MSTEHQACVCVLLSGGIDSTACIHFYQTKKLDVRPLFVNYGQPAATAERKAAMAVTRFYGLSLDVCSVGGIAIPRRGEIPGRNLFLISLALMKAKCDCNVIALGIHGGTSYYDCAPDFVNTCQRLVTGYTDGRVQLGAPFLTWTKSQILSYCKLNQVPLASTWSCETSSKHECGKCLSCRDKEQIYARA
jgi:7-cyano-7-deazaguanine synthase